MNMNKLKMMAVALSTAALVACGGGGDVAGDSAEFMLSQDEWTINGGTAWQRNPGSNELEEVDVCPGASSTPHVVTIIGGQPPFRIRNPLPTFVQVDRTETDGKDPRFVFTVLGGCAEFSITVHDYHSRVASVEVKLEAGKP